MSVKAPAIGIDLGTSNCCVAVFRQGVVHVIQNNGKLITPSCVAFTQDGRLFGDEAKSHGELDPKNTIFYVKRWLGSHSDQRLKSQASKWFYPVDSPNIAGYKVTWNGKKIQLTPEEVTAMVLSKLKEAAERSLGQKVTSAVVTVPSSFTHSQRQATIDAARIAGLNVLRLINETSAAAIAYAADKKSSNAINVLIYNMGAGFVDVSVLKITGGLFEVLSMVGDALLGGEEFDYELIGHFAREIASAYNKTLPASAVAKLKAACEKAKKALSTFSQVSIQIHSLLPGFDYTLTVSRATFEGICCDLFKRSLFPVRRALNLANMDQVCIDDVVLVGGSTRMPKIQSLLKDYFNGKDLISPERTDITKAYGASVQAAFITGEESICKEFFFLEELSGYDLAWESEGKFKYTLIKGNSKLPCSISQKVTTSVDSCTNLEYGILEEETQEKVCSQKMILSGIPLAPKHVPEIEVTFNIDLNGCLEVSATAQCFEAVKVLTVLGVTRSLKETEIERFKRNLVEYDREDAQKLLKTYAVGVKMAINQACDGAIKWVDENSTAKETEVKEILAKLQSLCISYATEGVSPL